MKRHNQSKRPANNKKTKRKTRSSLKARPIIWILGILCVAAIAIGIHFATLGSSDGANNSKTGSDTTISQPEAEKPRDTTPPVITGAKDVSLYTNDTYDFRSGITLSDDTDPHPELAINTSKVDFGTIGSYEATYTATDHSGNTATQTIKVNVSARDKVLYLTFDDGPSRFTPEILDILKDNQVRATFFVIGRSDNSLFKRIVDEGHAIGLHSETHDYSIYRSEQSFFSDLEAISQRVYDRVGFAPKIMRFIGGSSNTVSKRYSTGIMTRLVVAVHERGYKYYDWNCSVGDGSSNVTKDLEIELVHGCASNQKTMYLLSHDTSSITVAAMRELIPYLKAQGYDFQTITINTPEYRHGVAN